ncbi:MAG: phosphatidylglycerol lysyltransferase domain-containing protein [Bacillota bacterium]|jgi:hypothetical protein|nr:phosphatidylglycerol lysyltransferase domain-containing protein [Bacillota bacterium]HHU43357.1 DUF2156 domain-containing protein [Clostridiales bacterium]
MTNLKKSILSFKKISLDDYDLINSYLINQPFRICDYTPGVLYMWKGYLNYEFAISHDTLIIKSNLKGNVTFSIPLGEGDVKKALDSIKEYCLFHNIPMNFHGVTEPAAKILTDHFGDIFEIRNLENWGEYIYRYSDLLYLKGKKYHSKRNHINQFARNYHDYVFKEIKIEDIPRIRDFSENYYQQVQKDQALFYREKEMLYNILNDYHRLRLIGGYLEVEGNIAAFSIGEIQRDILFVHIEKADREYKGSYAVINNEFLNYFKHEDVYFVNREEDVGDEGLRKAKMSYHPIEIIKKFSVKQKI